MPPYVFLIEVWLALTLSKVIEENSLEGWSTQSPLRSGRVNPIPHGRGPDSAHLKIVFFITSARDAAEPQNLATFPRI